MSSLNNYLEVKAPLKNKSLRIIVFLLKANSEMVLVLVIGLQGKQKALIQCKCVLLDTTCVWQVCLHTLKICRNTHVFTSGWASSMFPPKSM